MPLPTVQPPAVAAPMPMSAPPMSELRAVAASGTRTRNSFDATAATVAPRRMPSTRSTPQSTVSGSPVVMNSARFALGVVIPRPELRPVAAESGQAITPMRPTSTAAG